MSFALLTQRITGNSSSTFNFGQTISAFVYGIQQFNITNGTIHSTLQNFGINYTVSFGTGVGHETVTLVQQLASGLDTQQSFADVTVLAYLGGADPPGIFMGNQPVVMGQTGLQPIVPDNSPYLSCGVLGGFNLSFASDSSNLLGIGAGAGTTCCPGSYDGGISPVAPVGVGALLGDSPFSGSVNAGYIIMGPNQQGIYFASAQCGPSVNPLNFFLGANLSSAAVLIQSFYAQFNIDTNPSPVLTSLTAGAAFAQIEGQTNVLTLVGLSYSGENFAGEGKGSKWVQSSVVNLVASVLVVGIT